MTATNHTAHYGLSQYTEDDRPTYTGDYNGDMTKIDAAIHAASQAGGMTKVEHTADLTGDGTDGGPLGVADAIARTESVTQAIASAIADRLTAGDIKPGNGINIETSGNQVTISYVGGGGPDGLTAVSHDATLTGDGTSGTPLRIVDGLNFSSFNAELAWDSPLSEVKTPGLYRIVGNPQNSRDSDLPDFIKDCTQSVAVLLVYKNSTAFIRIICVEYAATPSGGGLTLRCFGKTYASSASSEWFDLNPGGSDIPALTSRIAALESRVSALTAPAAPSTTGLTATQLDTQYSDDYNIVRAGTPTRSNESEDFSQ